MSSKLDGRPVRSRKEMVNNEYKSDVKFIVGKDKTEIYGHTILIESSSPVLFNIFNSDFEEKKTGSIKILDIEPEIFLAVLEFLYTEKVLINGENLVPVYYAAEKYMIEQLKQKCLQSIGLDNILSVLQTNMNYNISNIQNKCLEFIIDNPFHVFELADFPKLNKECLKLVLTQRYFKCTYDDLMEALTRWKDINKGIAVKDLENEILGYVKRRNQCQILDIIGDASFPNTNIAPDFLCIRLMALKEVELIGFGLFRMGNFKDLFIKIKIDNILVLEKNFGKGNDQVYFKKIRIEKKSDVSIFCTINGDGDTSIYALQNARIVGNTYFKSSGERAQAKTPIKYVIVENED